MIEQSPTGDIRHEKPSANPSPLPIRQRVEPGRTLGQGCATRRSDSWGGDGRMPGVRPLTRGDTIACVIVGLVMLTLAAFYTGKAQGGMETSDAVLTSCNDAGVVFIRGRRIDCRLV